jgi:predicted  nucleic acid-binding Zn-ribbon protein
VQSLLKRVQTARQRCDEVSRQKSRVSGELDAARRRYAETEKKCKETFDCLPVELPEIREQMAAEGRRLVEEAEAILAGPAQEVEPEEA